MLRVILHLLFRRLLSLDHLLGLLLLLFDADFSSILLLSFIFLLLLLNESLSCLSCEVIEMDLKVLKVIENVHIAFMRLGFRMLLTHLAQVIRVACQIILDLINDLSF